MSTWPSALPDKPLQRGYSRTQQSQVIRTEMSAGPAFVRRRFTAASDLFSMQFVLDTAERQTFWDFFNNTLAGGSLAFDWTDPVTGTAASFRFAGEPPNETALSGLVYQISATLELLP